MLEKVVFTVTILECRCGPTATVTSLKVLGMKVLIKHFKESGLTLEIMLRTQSCRPFHKSRKLLIFGILAKGDPMKISWKASILQMAESDIFYVK